MRLAGRSFRVCVGQVVRASEFELVFGGAVPILSAGGFLFEPLEAPCSDLDHYGGEAG